jgi:hexosaminidase
MKIILSALLLLMFIACEKPVSLDLTQANILPKPVEITASMSSFQLTENSIIYTSDEALSPTAMLLAEVLRPSTGFPLPVEVASQKMKKGSILLSVVDDPTLPNNEAYRLTITEKLVQLEAKHPSGIVRGIQTIRQLFPIEVEANELQQVTWLLPTGSILDYPEYEMRSTMLDVSRHFFPVETVKKYIDYLSYYKLNALHLHLSDDQGWRIEIKSWPNLTAIGGQTQVGGGEGGYYTQDDYRELVAYAAERYITIIPEIDMPGHTNAALASYAELNCDGKARPLYTGTNVGFSTLCIDKEITYRFVEDVVREISAMTPGEYFHIGGDESHVTPLKDYIPFINRVQEIVKAHGKQVLGWDEIAHANLDSTTVVQFWSNEKNANMGIAQGARVLMSPAKRMYIDMKYDSTTKLGLDWAATIEVDEAYNWDPANYAMGIQRENILGLESPLWSETVTTLDEIEFLAYPRLAAHAEIGWTVPDQRIWEEFKVRLGKHGKNMKALGIDFYRSPKVPWAD